MVIANQTSARLSLVCLDLIVGTKGQTVLLSAKEKQTKMKTEIPRDGRHVPMRKLMGQWLRASSNSSERYQRKMIIMIAHALAQIGNAIFDWVYHGEMPLVRARFHVHTGPLVLT